MAEATITATRVRVVRDCQGEQEAFARASFNPSGRPLGARHPDPSPFPSQLPPPARGLPPTSLPIIDVIILVGRI